MIEMKCFTVNTEKNFGGFNSLMDHCKLINLIFIFNQNKKEFFFLKSIMGKIREKCASVLESLCLLYFNLCFFCLKHSSLKSLVFQNISLIRITFFGQKLTSVEHFKKKGGKINSPPFLGKYRNVL